MEISVTITTEAQALDLIRKLASEFSLSGVGYVGLPDLERALDNIQNNCPGMPSLEEGDVSSLWEYLSNSYKGCVIPLTTDILEGAVLEELGQWYEDSEQMKQERDSQANYNWHVRMRTFLQKLYKTS